MVVLLHSGGFIYLFLFNTKSKEWDLRACDEESRSMELVTLGPLACRPHEQVAL